MDFSWKQRLAWLSNWDKEIFDVLIIGGGITGAGILLDAQSRGLKAMLIEMQDFAAGTSSRSTKLIHGGLRYLKNMEFKLVAEVGREREIVHENGPHVTKAERMLIPIIKNGSLGKLSTSLGVWLYDRLAHVPDAERRKVLSVEETLQAEPLLKSELLKGGILYYEYRTDDARLTMEILKKAVELGAKAINYSKVTAFTYKNGKVTGVRLRDMLSLKEYDLESTYIVNATGPWADQLMALDDPSKGGKLFLTKGVHLVVDHAKLPIQQSAYFDTEDGRMVFAIPREGKTYFGTTDTPYSDDIKDPSIEREDVEYLLKAVKKIFSGIDIRPEDVIGGWSGLRPLIREEGKSPSQISRKDEIFVNASGLISIAGGKLTGYRKMAEKVVDLIGKEALFEGTRSIPECKTEGLKVSGGDVGGSARFPSFIEKATPYGQHSGLTAEEAQTIAHVYGSNAIKLFDIAAKEQEDAAKAKLPLFLYIRLVYALRKEMMMAPADFFIRRTSSLYFHPEEVSKHKEAVIRFMKESLGWPEDLEHRFREELEFQIRLHTGFKRQ